MTAQKLSSSVSEQLGYYVYLYVNPLDEQIFYVGKGKGDRVFAHLREESNTPKGHLIKEIHAAGQEPRIEILAHGLPDEETAYRMEAAVIDILGIENLTNCVRGWRSGYYGRMALDHLLSLYEREKATITEPVILIRITQLYHYGMSAIELYDATRGVWKIGERRHQAHYAFAVFEGIVREVYKIEQWFPAGTTFSIRARQELCDPDRWEFVGRVADPAIREKYLLRSVEDYFKPTAQNPVQYVNC